MSGRKVNKDQFLSCQQSADSYILIVNGRLAQACLSSLDSNFMQFSSPGFLFCVLRSHLCVFLIIQSE